MNEDLYSKSIICPLCESQFKTCKVRHGRILTDRTDTDLFKYFRGENPYVYEINVCPRCGFSFSDSFEQELSDRQRKEFLDKVSRHWPGRDFGGEREAADAIETFKLALLTGQVLGMKNSVMGSLCLRISGLCRMMGETSEEEKFTLRAINFMEKAYEVEDFESQKGIRPEIIAYLLGELNFRLKRYNDCSKWFQLCISRYCSNPDVKKNISEMIRDRWQEIKYEIGHNIDNGH